MPCGMRGGGVPRFHSHLFLMAVTWPDGGLPSPPRSRSHFIRRSPGAAFSLDRPSLPVMRPATSRVHRAIWFFILFQYIITPPGRCQERGGFLRRGCRVGIMVQCSRFGHGRGRRPGSPAAARHGGALGLGTRPNRRKTCRKKGREPSGARSLRAVPLFFRHLPRGGKSGTMERINRQYSTKFDTCGSHSQERRRKICIA